MNIKEQIDKELSAVTFSIHLKDGVNEQLKQPKKTKMSFSRAVTVVLTVLLLAGAGVCAGQVFYGKTNVNDVTIPNLDHMAVVENTKLSKRLSDPFDPYSENKSYDFYVKEIDIPLLDTEFAIETPYMHTSLQTDYENFCTINVMNYILGDTKNHEIVDQDTGRCKCSPGEEYYSPIHLKVDMILSQEQYDIGWNVDYLGYYEFVESYISSNGYKVNIIQDTTYKETSSKENIRSEKVAIFVANGIRYTLKGRTSFENMKMIVDSMN